MVVTTIVATITSFRGRMPKVMTNNLTFAFSGRFYKLNHGVLKVTLCFTDVTTIVRNIPTSSTSFLVILFHCVGDTQVNYPSNIGTVNANTKSNGDKKYTMFTFAVNKLLHDTLLLMPRILRMVLGKQMIFGYIRGIRGFILIVT